MIDAALALTVEWYEDPLPPWLEAALIALHGNLYSTLEAIRLFNPGAALSAFVLRRGDAPVQIVVFGIDGRRANVLNAVIRLGADEIALFARGLFARCPRVSAIAFQPSQVEAGGLAYPHQHGVVQEDIVVTLPGTADEFRMRLGGETRRNLKRRSDQLDREHPSNAFEARVGADVPDEWIGEILRFHYARMASKNKQSGIDREYEREIRALVRRFGVVGVVTIEGRIAAGAIGYRVGANHYLHVIAHDPRYDRVSLGRLCVYAMIRDCIGREAREFHFLWGEYDYKYNFLGVRRDLALLTVYRSRLHVLLHPHLFLATAARLARRRLKPRIAALRQRLHARARPAQRSPAATDQRESGRAG